RYREIFELNAGRLQPDGSRLTIASLIRPGWILRLPRDAHGPGIRVVTRHEDAHAPGGDVPNGPAPEQPGATGGGKTAPAPPGHAVPGRAGGATPPPAAPAGVVPAARGAPAPAGTAVYPYELAAAALLAAGVLSAL